MTRATSRVGVALSAVALLVLPGACADQEAEYCAVLGKHQTVFADDGSGQTLLDSLPTLTTISRAAPEDLTDEWQVFLGALEALRQKVAAAGVSPDDVTGGVRPDDVSVEDWAAIKAAANDISSPTVAEALNGIDQQAKDVCKLQLGL